MRVSQLAELLSIPPDTVRYYTREKLLNPVKSPENGYREYQANDISRLRFIVSARQLGFSMEDIRQLLSDADHGKSPCPNARKLLKLRLQETEQRFQEMVALRARMQAALDQWEDKPDATPTGSMICHLVESFQADASHLSSELNAENLEITS